jgi:hypothetical protein
MTRDEFLSLPPTLALRLLFDALDEETTVALLRQECPKVPRSPKYDQPIYRRDGIMWASETDAEGLRFWLGKYQASAAGGGQYAEADAKRAKQMEHWIAWRECFPDAAWSGERDRTSLVAKPPSNRPAVYPRAGNGQRQQAPQTQQQDDIDPEADIPF